MANQHAIDPLDRITERIEFTDGCWLWQGKQQHGYGLMKIAGKQLKVHRVLYEQVVGQLPKETTLDHLCRVRNCVNPDHLEPVSPGENVLRGEGLAAVNARKTQCQYGHEFTLENTYLYRGMRTCRSCRAEKQRQRNRR